MPENILTFYTPAGSLYGNEPAGFNRRAVPDRRQDRLRAFFCSFFMDRRHGPRRSNDEIRDCYVDAHEPRYFYVVILTLGLCLVDIFFTLTIINNGGEEINPFVAWLMENSSTRLFIGAKFFLTAAGLVFLLAHKHFRVMRLNSAQLLYIILSTYVALIVYQLLLLNRIYS